MEKKQNIINLKKGCNKCKQKSKKTNKKTYQKIPS